MKKYYRVAKQMTLPLACLLLLAGCIKDDCRHTYTLFSPVYQKLSALRAKVQSGPAQPLNNPGKLYLYGDYIYLNEQNKGIHVIDNSDPTHPRNASFITMPGNIDIAARGSVLYADMYCDLATLDISNPSAATVKNYLTNTFHSVSNYNPSTNVDSINIVTAWTTRDTVLSCEGYSQLNRCTNCGIFLSPQLNTLTSAAATTGTAGSEARFATVGNWLYAVDIYQLNVIDVTDAANPLAPQRLSLGGSAETIYPLKNNLFIGTTTGMEILDIQNPATPKLLSWTGHWCAWDPAIADGNYAYVTLHSGICGSAVDEMDIYDVTSLSSPRLVKTYPLNGPQGLSKDGNLLFVCDGTAGLKIYDATKPTDIKLVGQVPNINAYDIITLNGIAYVDAKDGLYQYRYNGAGKMSLLSKLQWSFSTKN
ncbi:MAG TPA: hypothetical protein VGM41_21125 [Chitinophagaceae bacterium]|jgi:hypothetical protein